MEPNRLYPAIVFFSLVTVEFGGWSLLRLLSGAGELTDFQEQFFRAGHGHAGVLLVLSLVYFVFLERARFARRTEWLLGGVLLGGALAVSGGFFVHFAFGAPAEASAGTVITLIGAVAVAVALVALAVGLLRAGRPAGGAP